MNNKFFLALIAAFSLICGAFAVEMDRLAVAEPVNKGGIKTEDVEAIWSMLESSIGGDYEVISRAALKQIMTEIGLTTSSDLMNLNSAQKARLGQIKTVKYLLVPTVGKFGSRITLSLSLMNSSTGSIDPDGSISKVFRNFDELADQLKDTLNEIGLLYLHLIILPKFQQSVEFLFLWFAFAFSHHHQEHTCFFLLWL